MTQEESVQVRGAGVTQDPGSGQLEHIRAGDRAAFKALFQAHYGALCRYALRYVDSVEIAEDLVQDVFFDLWKRRAACRPEHSLKAFLYGAVRNQTLNHLRRVRRQASEPDALGDLLSREDPEETMHVEELRRVAERAVSELPPRCRDVFVLSREHELSYAEIGAALGISVKTVETHMGRALQHLRDRLSAHRSSRRA